MVTSTPSTVPYSNPASAEGKGLSSGYDSDFSSRPIVPPVPALAVIVTMVKYLSDCSLASPYLLGYKNSLGNENV